MPENDLIILIVLAVVAAFLLFRLRNVLGERTGFEDPNKYARQEDGGAESGDRGVVVPMPKRGAMEDDADIFAFTELDSELGQGLKAIKNAEPNFDARDFVEGAKVAYEMLLSAYESGDRDTLRQFLSDDVFSAFSDAIAKREEDRLSVDMRFIGFKSAEPIEASLDPSSSEAEVSVRFVAEVISATRSERGDVVEGDPSVVQKITDVWTFRRRLGTADLNWTLAATGE